MSGSDVAGTLIPAPQGTTTLADATSARAGRLAWPAATLLILLLSAGLWFGLGMVLSHLLR
ncbi:MAG: hypothetical protein K2X74_06215 [Acetobacteraceae bacterium]|nr:hypothetical protein [Acetobacteraceae bacterium]